MLMISRCILIVIEIENQKTLKCEGKNNDSEIHESKVNQYTFSNINNLRRKKKQSVLLREEIEKRNT